MKMINNLSAVKSAIEDSCGLWLSVTAEAVTEKVKNNTVADSGKTRNGWSCIVNTDEKYAVIGNPLENAVWEEFGTGEYALSGDGRKNGWVYCDKNGEFHFTYGKPPKRPFMRAYLECLDMAVSSAENIFGEVMK